MTLITATVRRLAPFAAAVAAGAVAWLLADQPLWRSSLYDGDWPAFSADGHTLTTVLGAKADADGRLRLRVVRREARGGRILANMPLVWRGQPPTPNEFVTVAKVGSRLVCGLNRTGRFGYTIYDGAGRELAEMPADGRYLNGFSHDGQWLLLARETPPRADIVATDTGATVLSLTPPDGFDYWRAAFAPCGDEIAMLWVKFNDPDRAQSIQVFALPDGRLTRTLSLPGGGWTGLHPWCEDGRLYVERRVAVPDDQESSERAIVVCQSLDAFKADAGPPRAEPLLTKRDGFGADNRYAERGHGWVLQVDGSLPTLAQWRGWINRAAMSFGWSTPFPARSICEARLFDATTGTVQMRLSVSDGVPSVSPDGRLIATADAAGLAVWDVERTPPAPWALAAGAGTFAGAVGLRRFLASRVAKCRVTAPQ